MLSFNVKSLFTNVPLDVTIRNHIILRKVYDEGETETNIPRRVMKGLLLLCTKHVHFIFNGDTHIQLDGYIHLYSVIISKFNSLTSLRRINVFHF